MSFTNPPLQGKPPANALGLQSVQQIEREARSNQIAPSADIMVRRTTKRTLLSLRNKGTAGDDPAVFMTTVANYLHAPLVTQPHLECGEVFVVDDAGRILAPPPGPTGGASGAQVAARAPSGGAAKGTPRKKEPMPAVPTPSSWPPLSDTTGPAWAPPHSATSAHRTIFNPFCGTP